MTDSDIVERAAAKVNLTLRIGRARADGYHPLDSLVLFADWGDTISVQPSAALTLSMSGEASRALANDQANLVLRAARALQAAAGITTGAAIHLEKLIPVSAGLGSWTGPWKNWRNWRSALAPMCRPACIRSP